MTKGFGWYKNWLEKSFCGCKK